MTPALGIVEYGTMVGVNVSGRQLDDPAFADIVLETLADAGLPGSALVLELTESSLIENTADPTVRAQLDRLRDEGVRIAIDDFGTGYSSLSYITRLPVDAVKIDSSFTRSPVGPTARGPVRVARSRDPATHLEPRPRRLSRRASRPGSKPTLAEAELRLWPGLLLLPACAR